MTRVRLGAGAEFDLIRGFLGDGAGEALAGVRVGPGDDCAVLADGLALSVDMAVEDVHFRRAWLEPREIGYRAAAAALSDLAAVAATPIGVLIALGLPAGDGDAVALGVMTGVRELARACGAVILGGDVTRSPGPLIIDVTAVGRALEPVLRNGALPGDDVWVTGTLGGAAAAVEAWRSGSDPDAAARLAFARPRPRTAEAVWLAARLPLHAMLDLSDGLAGDASHIAAASGVAIVIDEGDVPVHAAAMRLPADRALRLALAGGEDYEICFTAPNGSVEPHAAAFSTEFGIPLTRVGFVTEGTGVLLRGRDGGTRQMPFGGFDHRRGTGP